jgi:hypothetical protein
MKCINYESEIYVIFFGLLLLLFLSDFSVLTAVLLFWDVTSCRLVNIYDFRRIVTSSSSEYNGPGRDASSAGVRNFGNLSPSISCDIPEDLSLLSFYKATECNSGTRKRLKKFITLNVFICLVTLNIDCVENVGRKCSME